MGLCYGKEPEYCGSSVPVSMKRADALAPAPEDWKQETRISTFYLQGLGPQCPNGNAFHFAPQRAVLVCGDSDRAVIAP